VPRATLGQDSYAGPRASLQHVHVITDSPVVVAPKAEKISCKKSEIA
jgi:hypothetical protein